jgi:hypothetical protein
VYGLKKGGEGDAQEIIDDHGARGSEGPPLIHSFFHEEIHN